MHFKVSGTHIKIGDVLRDLKKREIPIVRADASIDEVIDALVGSGNDGTLYVVDTGNTLVGTISLDTLVRHVFSLSHEPKVHPRRIMDIVTTETAGHLMKKNPLCVTEADDIGSTIKRMIKSQAKHVALVNRKRNVTGDIAMVDLIKILVKANRGPDRTEKDEGPPS